jgi:protein SCO1
MGNKQQQASHRWRFATRRDNIISGRVKLLLALILAAGTAAMVYVYRDTTGPPELAHGTVLPQPRDLPQFVLLDQHAQPVTRATLEDRWTLLFAGFTHCPDICPATLATLARLDERLGSAAAGLQIAFLSLDPQRDDPATLAPYLGHFNPRVIGLTGEPAEIERLARAIGLTWMRVPFGDDYTIDHSAALMLIDPRARVVGYFRPPLHVDGLADDLGPLARRAR